MLHWRLTRTGVAIVTLLVLLASVGADLEGWTWF
jgi:hypothetical protein